MDTHNGSPKAVNVRQPKRVLVADDSSQVREELGTLLSLASDIEIVGMAGDGVEAIRLTERLRPDVILLDLQMPVLDGYEAARQIKERCPSCRVIALTVHGYEAARQKAMEAGVDAFLVKGAAVESLVQAISEEEE